MILYISTFPPVKCGIASFTEDLITAVNQQVDPAFSIRVCALDNPANATPYDPVVGMVMDGYSSESCIAAADTINNDPAIRLVCIEHEFGLFGGEMGEYLLGFLSMLEKPFVIRFHTVLPSPDAKRQRIVGTIALLAEQVIVMTRNSARLLQGDYSIPTDKITIIPHGLHQCSTENPATLKQRYGLSNKKVLTTFGLLSPNKGIEKGILAMKDVSARFPDAVYVVVGLTHPNLLQREGEKYREYLQQLIDDNQLGRNVRLVNEYVPTQKLMEYLGLTDIYLFTSKDPYQAVSGTFLYAMSAGCAIISNSFVLATEMLDEHTGIIDGGDEKQLAKHAIMLLENDRLRKRMGFNAFLKTRNSTWDKVSEKHIALFYEILGWPARASESSSGQVLSK